MANRKTQLKHKIYSLVSRTNDRAFSLITICFMSTTLTALDFMLNLTNKVDSLLYAFLALGALVVSTLLSSSSKLSNWFRTVSAFLCTFLWLFVAHLSGVLSGSNIFYSSAFYAVLFWSNVNLLGVFINGRK